MPRSSPYQQGVVERLSKGLQSTLASRKIDTIAGEGTLTSANSVAVGDATYTGDYIVLATGSVPRSLPGLSIDGARVISSDEGLALDRVPKSGDHPRRRRHRGGVRLGVALLRRGRDDRRDGAAAAAARGRGVGQGAAAGVRRRGIAFELGTPFQSVSYTDDGVSVDARQRPRSAELLVAVGRGPVSADLGYDEAVGVAITRGYVDVDGYCRTSVPNIFAVGDLVATPQLARVDKLAEGILVAEQIGGLDVRPIDYDGVPRITYSEPEVASVGIHHGPGGRTRHQRGRGELPARRQRQVGHPPDAGPGRAAVASMYAWLGPRYGVRLVGGRVGGADRQGAADRRLGRPAR